MVKRNRPQSFRSFLNFLHKAEWFRAIQSHGQRGASLVALLIAVAIIGVLALVIVGKTDDRMNIIAYIRGTDAVGEVETALKATVRDVVGNYLEESLCGVDSTFLSLNWGSGSDYDITWLKPSDVATKLNYTGNAAHQAAKARCASQTFTSGTENVLDATNMYICVLIEPKAGAKTGAMLKLASAFAEFSIRFVDLSTGSEQSCRTLIDPPASAPLLSTSGRNAVYTRGLAIYYSLYSQSGTTQSKSYVTTNGVTHGKMHY